MSQKIIIIIWDCTSNKRVQWFNEVLCIRSFWDNFQLKKEGMSCINLKMASLANC